MNIKDLLQVSESNDEKGNLDSLLVPGAHRVDNRVVTQLLSIRDLKKLIESKYHSSVAEAFLKLAVDKEVPAEYAELLEFLQDRKDTISVICTQRLLKHAERNS